MTAPARSRLRLRIAPPLLLFVPVRRRRAELDVPYDGSSTLGHVVQSVGVPLPEVGRLLLDGALAEAGRIPRGGEVVELQPVPRPQPVPSESHRFLLDVHLGSLARRLRLLGVDTAYHVGLDDDALAEEALARDRMLLTKDRGLLMRRSVRDTSAYVRGDGAAEQVRDVLDRFRPALRPYTRCPACNGLLLEVAKAEIADRLEPGTARSYQRFRRCAGCERVYWRGAHAPELEAIVAAAGRPATGHRSLE